ncbi:MAG TPA: proton-conducting transporter membrane subunit [Acetobacteraceae bacterium]|nr:proton-conducting transporter membrane subunit [Acetobacteraceae bacterium]
MIGQLPPLPVAGPLAVAGLLLVFSHVLPKYVPDVIALLTALGAGIVCIIMAMHTARHPLVYWFGGWAPRHGLVLGIGFVVDQVEASLAAFVALLFFATLVFAWGYYDEVHAHFHVLMLLFMAGMIGFCLTHDLFNMFVWFEVMSVAAFALTGYALRSSALGGALNFTVVNTIGSYLILGGIGLIYSRVGALDFAALGRGVAAAPADPVITASFALIATGLLIKAAQVPFQFWLADAHAVAPSPVSVIFSGAMVAIGLYGVAKLTWSVYLPSPEIRFVVHRLLLGMGAASTVLGGVMALVQRHIKRLLAFSTISHVGIMLIGLALLDRTGLAGMFVYLVGHGLVKGALFMVAGIMLASLGGIDEIGLRGKGRDIWPAGIAMAAGGLLLAGLPVGLMDKGSELIDAAIHRHGQVWLMAAMVAGSAFTGAAVLRVTGRVFLGLGQVPGEEERSPSDDEQEKADRPLWLMMLPTSLLLLLALCAAHAAGEYAARIVLPFMHPQAEAILGLAPMKARHPAGVPEAPASWVPWFSVALALAIAAFELTRRHLPRLLVAPIDKVLNPALGLLRTIHSGLISDYITWLVVGLALFGLTFALS